MAERQLPGVRHITPQLTENALRISGCAPLEEHVPILYTCTDTGSQLKAARPRCVRQGGCPRPSWHFKPASTAAPTYRSPKLSRFGGAPRTRRPSFATADTGANHPIYCSTSSRLVTMAETSNDDEKSNKRSHAAFAGDDGAGKPWQPLWSRTSSQPPKTAH